ncbi:MAG: hypothetical protein AAGA22_01050 [Pseudomonadota bacterium]
MRSLMQDGETLTAVLPSDQSPSVFWRQLEGTDVRLVGTGPVKNSVVVRSDEPALRQTLSAAGARFVFNAGAARACAVTSDDKRRGTL